MKTLEQLKKQKNAVIIAHYYQESEIQDSADYVGDSLGMALYAQKQDCKIAVVAGVRFMAETIKVMNPEKKVLLPDLNAGCSLADSCTPEVFSYFLGQHPGAFVMTYVNSSLEIKAMSDVICTSANAVKIAQKIPPGREIIFGPDQHLGKFISKKLGRPMILFPGNCFVHTSFSAREMVKLKTRHPDAEIIAHPECEEVILREAQFVGSTGQLLKYTQESKAQKFIVMTEPGIIHQMKKASPQKTFIEGPDLEGCACNNCPHMKLNTFDKLVHCLEKEEPEILIPASLQLAAMKPLEKMVEMTGAI
ncbi:MAG: quinolinate synthase NadA [Deltaproteobacteria bacterium]|nr:quinolinate synthase NadA [Deltaproteobacteria bacterium]